MIECYNKRVEEMKAGGGGDRKGESTPVLDSEMSRFRGVSVANAMTPTVEPVNVQMPWKGSKAHL